MRLAVLAWIILSASTAFAIRCYVCAFCNTVSGTSLTDCGKSVDQCVTATDGSAVVRSCSASNKTLQEGCTKVTTNAGTIETCYCSGDSCNSKTNFTPGSDELGVQCYVCSSCDYVFNSQLEYCGPSVTRCAKTTVNGVVSRSCGDFIPPSTEDGCQKVSTDGSEAEFCYCTGDACNGKDGGSRIGGGSSTYSVVLLCLLSPRIVSYFIV